jgi:hypothetical protein
MASIRLLADEELDGATRANATGPVIPLTRKDHHGGWEHLVMIKLLRSAASHTAMKNAFDLYL